MKKHSLHLVIAVLIMVLLILSYLTIQKLPKPEPVPEPAGLTAQLEGTIKSYRNDLLGKKITIDKAGEILAFKIQNSTIIYKCTDFSNINSCIKTDQGIKTSQNVQILAKGDTVLFILFK